MALESRSAAAISFPSSEDVSCSINSFRSPGLNGFGRAASAAAACGGLGGLFLFLLVLRPLRRAEQPRGHGDRYRHRHARLVDLDFVGHRRFLGHAFLAVELDFARAGHVEADHLVLFAALERVLLADANQVVAGLGDRELDDFLGGVLRGRRRAGQRNRRSKTGPKMAARFRLFDQNVPLLLPSSSWPLPGTRR